MKIVTSLFLVYLLSCNSLSEHFQQHIGEQVNNSKKEMRLEIEREKQDFLDQFKKVIGNKNDRNSGSELHSLKNGIIISARFFDSLENEMDKLDNLDLKNIQLVKNIFIYNGIGDTIQLKVKSCAAMAQRIAKSTKGKAIIQSIQDSLFSGYHPDKWNELMFGQTSPLGASITLSGLQADLFSIGLQSLKDQ